MSHTSRLPPTAASPRKPSVPPPAGSPSATRNRRHGYVSPLLSLPAVARDPAGYVRDSPRQPQEARSPYVIKGALPDFDRQLHGDHRSGSPSSTTMSRATSGTELAVDTKKEAASERPAPQATTTTAEQQQVEPSAPAAAAEPTAATAVPPQRLTELTSTYLRVLQRSEDYSRRSLERHRTEALDFMSVPYRRLLTDSTKAFEERDTFVKTEAAERQAVEQDERRTVAGVHKQCEVAYQAAKRHEEIQPLCPAITPGQRTHIDPGMLNGLIAELRWRGAIDFTAVAYVYDDRGQLMSYGSPTDIVKGPDSKVAIRYFASSFAGGVSVKSFGGARVTFQMILPNLPSRAKQVVFCAFATPIGSPLTELSRCWLSLLSPEKPPRELFTVNVGKGSAEEAGLVMAAVEKRTANVWQFVSINQRLSLVTSVPKCGALVNALASDPLSGVSEHELPYVWDRHCFTAFTQLDETWRLFIDGEEALARATWHAEATETMHQLALMHHQELSRSVTQKRRGTLRRASVFPPTAASSSSSSAPAQQANPSTHRGGATPPPSPHPHQEEATPVPGSPPEKGGNHTAESHGQEESRPAPEEEQATAGSGGVPPAAPPAGSNTPPAASSASPANEYNDDHFEN